MALTDYQHRNNAQGTLSAGISAAATSIILQTGEGAKFPNVYPFFVTIEQYDTSSRVIKREIVRCTNRSTDTLTVVRSAGTCPPAYNSNTPGTTAFAFNAGDTVTQALTAEAIDDMQNEILLKLDKTGGQLTGRIWEAKGADLASAATVTLANATGNFVHITGTTTITSFGANTAGLRVVVRFAGALTLTHNATSLILPSAANIVTAANDTATFIGEGGSNWRCVNYEKANGQSIDASANVNGLTEDTAGDMNADFVLEYDASATANRKVKPSVWRASDAEALAGTATNKFVTPAQLRTATKNIVGSPLSRSASTTYTETVSGIVTAMTEWTSWYSWVQYCYVSAFFNPATTNTKIMHSLTSEAQGWVTMCTSISFPVVAGVPWIVYSGATTWPITTTINFFPNS